MTFIEKRLTLLQCLENTGVDNWEGYSIAQDDYNKIIKENAINDRFGSIISDALLDCSIELTEDPHLPNIVYDGNLHELYKIVKNFIIETEEI